MQEAIRRRTGRVALHEEITSDDLKRYRDAGVDEVVVVNMRAPRTPEEAARGVEEAARKWIDAAAKL